MSFICPVILEHFTTLMISMRSEKKISENCIPCPLWPQTDCTKLGVIFPQWWIFIHWEESWFLDQLCVVISCHRLPSAVVESPGGFKRCVEVHLGTWFLHFQFSPPSSLGKKGVSGCVGLNHHNVKLHKHVLKTWSRSLSIIPREAGLYLQKYLLCDWGRSCAHRALLTHFLA